MNPFKDLFFQESAQSSDTDNLIISRQAINRVITLFMLLMFGIFMTGYFLGKRKAAELFNRSVEQDAGSDKINLSLVKVYDRFQKNDEPDVVGKNVESFEEFEGAVSPAVAAHEGAAVAVRYQAQLLGGTSQMVQKFVDRLAHKGITVLARKRSSKTAQGKIMYWHQALTPIMDDRESVEALVERIKKFEKIDGIRIVEIKN